MSFNLEVVNPEDAIRTAKRRYFEGRVTLEDPAGMGEVSLECRDMSATGLFVYSPVFAEIGSVFRCHFVRGEDEEMERLVQVVRVHLDKESPGKSGMGLRFVTPFQSGLAN